MRVHNNSSLFVQLQTTNTRRQLERSLRSTDILLKSEKAFRLRRQAKAL